MRIWITRKFMARTTAYTPTPSHAKDDDKKKNNNNEIIHEVFVNWRCHGRPQWRYHVYCGVLWRSSCWPVQPITSNGAPKQSVSSPNFGCLFDFLSLYYLSKEIIWHGRKLEWFSLFFLDFQSSTLNFMHTVNTMLEYHHAGEGHFSQVINFQDCTIHWGQQGQGWTWASSS